MKKYICIILLLVIVSMTLPAVAFAETSYSNVLDDLQQDKDFYVADYPKIKDDYSLQVIQIAESIAGELLVYVYQPCGKLQATCIHLAQEKEPATEDTHEYKLTLLSSEETLFKYKVEGIKLKNSTVRYYDITSIFRPWDAKLDVGTDNDNVTNEVAFEVAQLWTVTDTNEGVTYAMTGVETIKILNPSVSHVEYSNGWGLFTSSRCNSHYVAFSTDKRMDDLLEASVYFEQRTVTQQIFVTRGDWVEREVLVSKDDVVTNPNGTLRLWAQDYEFSRIVKAQDFVVNETLTDDVKNEIADAEWVLRFTETPFSVTGGSFGTAPMTMWTEIANVTILRLKFETDGKVYNMGTVMNKITNPIGFELPEIPWWVWAIVAIVVLAIVACLVKPVATVIVWVFKIVFWILTAPFKLIGLLFGRDKK